MTDPERSEWPEWTDAGRGEGRVNRPAPRPTWSVPPEVELDGEWLVFGRPVRALGRGKRVLQKRKVRAGTRLLTEFVMLGDAPAHRILEFARRYGPFGFCKHGDLTHRLGPEGCGPDLLASDAREAVQFREAVESWRGVAGHARALLDLAAQLFKGKVEPTTLARLNPQLLSSARLLKAARREPAPFVAYGLELWLRFFQVRPRATYNPRRRRFEAQIGGSPALPGALALQLMRAMTRSVGIAICSACGKPFPPARRPNPNRSTYCKDCGIRAAWREAQARRREGK
jgi:hypothetical protein